MGLSVGEILSSNSFKDYLLVAGHKGLGRKVHAVTAFDAPDSYKWFKGRELFVTTGYPFRNDFQLLMDVIKKLNEKNAAGLGIKKNRYLDSVPDFILEYCDNHDFPVFYIPERLAWVDVINDVNSLVLNKLLLKLNNSSFNSSFDDQNPEGSIKNIIKLLSEEIEEEVMLFETINNNIFYCTNDCKDCGRDCKSKDLDYLWNPNFSYRKEVICEELNIIKYSTLEENNDYINSWVSIPVNIGDNIIAYLIIFEKNDKLDFYDYYAIRLSITLILYLYKQIYSTYELEGFMQDEFIKDLIDGKYKDYKSCYQKSKKLKIDLSKNYISIIIEQLNEEIKLINYRDTINKIFSSRELFFGMKNANRLICLYHINSSDEKSKELLYRDLNEIINLLENFITDSKFICGVSNKSNLLYNIQSSYFESLKALEIGKYIFPNEQIITFNQLGPFSLFRVEFFQDGVLNYEATEFENLNGHPDREELLHTLRVFLNNNSNYNLAAEELFVHSNTVRYRINKIQQICSIDLNDSTERLKIQLILKFWK